jgi:diguanylate cyclase (GGDEF)-like protein
LSIRLRLSLLVVAGSLALLAVFATLSLEQIRVLSQQEMEKRGQSMLGALGVAAAVAIANDDIPTLDNHISRLAGSEGRRLDLVYLAVLDHEGTILAHTDSARFGRRRGDAFAVRAIVASNTLSRYIRGPRGEPQLELSMPVVSGLRWGTLLAGFSLVRVERDLARRQRAYLVGIAVALVLAGAALFGALQRSVVGPLRKLAAVAERIRGGELRARSGLTRKDEIGALAGTFDAMAERLQGYTEDLERRVAERTEALARANRELERLATTDGLTDLKNHRAFREMLDFEHERTARSGSPLSLLMIDVDHFKAYNDRRGHPQGDRVLRTVARTIVSAVRATDVAARYGGEEFAVLLLDTGKDAAAAVGEKVRAAIEAVAFPYGEEQPLGRVTISVGVACLPEDATSGSDLVERADLALYAAKRGGRNRVVAYAADLPRPTRSRTDLPAVPTPERAR